MADRDRTLPHGKGPVFDAAQIWFPIQAGRGFLEGSVEAASWRDGICRPLIGACVKPNRARTGPARSQASGGLSFGVEKILHGRQSPKESKRPWSTPEVVGSLGREPCRVSRRADATPVLPFAGRTVEINEVVDARCLAGFRTTYISRSWATTTNLRTAASCHHPAGDGRAGIAIG